MKNRIGIEFGVSALRNKRTVRFVSRSPPGKRANRVALGSLRTISGLTCR